MTTIPPTSCAGRPLDKTRVREAQLRFPWSLFARGEKASHDSQARSARSSGGVSPTEERVATMLEGLELDGTERVLEVGSDTAYPAALLSALAAEVFSIVPSEELAEQRQRELSMLGCHNARVIQSDIAEGWAAAAPYQAIIIAAGTTSVPPGLIDQLETGGRLVAPIGDAAAQLIVRFHKRAASLDSETLGACHSGMLSGSRRMPSLFPWTKVP